jgi:hypothetical protein
VDQQSQLIAKKGFSAPEFLPTFADFPQPAWPAAGQPPAASRHSSHAASRHAAAHYDSIIGSYFSQPASRIRACRQISVHANQSRWLPFGGGTDSFLHTSLPATVPTTAQPNPPLPMPTIFRTVLWMHQSGGYLFGPQWAFPSGYRLLSARHAQAYWVLVNQPRQATIESIGRVMCEWCEIPQMREDMPFHVSSTSMTTGPIMSRRSWYEEKFEIVAEGHGDPYHGVDWTEILARSGGTASCWPLARRALDTRRMAQACHSAVPMLQPRCAAHCRQTPC